MNRTREADIDYRTWTQEQFEEDMRNNPKYQPFFAPYGKTWVDYFMKEHAEYRFKAFAQLERNRHDHDYPYKEIETMAHQFLDEILEKKLFNVQCFWRAGEIDLPYIRLTSDFNFFSKDLKNCPLY